MKRLTTLLWISTIAILATIAAWLGPRAAGARQDLDRALQSRDRVVRLASEHAALTQSQQGRWPAEPGKLAPAASAALAAAGLPPTALANLSPPTSSTERIGPDAAGSGGRAGAGASEAVRLVRRRATISLHQLTLPQLGRFLAGWQEHGRGWTVSRIDLDPMTGRDGRAAPGSDLPIRAALMVESVRIDTEQEDR